MQNGGRPLSVSTAYARKLRRDETDVELKLWLALRNRRFAGFKFRRQVPRGPYIVDFFCAEAKLIIELDGGQHADRQEEDKIRSAYLESLGYRVVRFWNNEVTANFDGVLAIIADALQISKTPSP